MVLVNRHGQPPDTLLHILLHAVPIPVEITRHGQTVGIPLHGTVGKNIKRLSIILIQTAPSTEKAETLRHNATVVHGPHDERLTLMLVDAFVMVPHEIIPPFLEFAIRHHGGHGVLTAHRGCHAGHGMHAATVTTWGWGWLRSAPLVPVLLLVAVPVILLALRLSVAVVILGSSSSLALGSTVLVLHAHVLHAHVDTAVTAVSTTTTARILIVVRTVSLLTAVSAVRMPSVPSLSLLSIALGPRHLTLLLTVPTLRLTVLIGGTTLLVRERGHAGPTGLTILHAARVAVQFAGFRGEFFGG
mmetsp:Transcript_45240/g.52974  ORF Transcript_45240/g.52974 Transcript_45240/m.52974 type:complete len:301 (-) Transcript_45240:515-1417(-)